MLSLHFTLLTHQEAVRVRTDKANFGPAPISLSFSLEVNNSIPCTNITFILINVIYFIFYETILKVTPKLLNLSSVTPIIKL